MPDRVLYIFFFFFMHMDILPVALMLLGIALLCTRRSAMCVRAFFDHQHRGPLVRGC